MTYGPGLAGWPSALAGPGDNSTATARTAYRKPAAKGESMTDMATSHRRAHSLTQWQARLVAVLIGVITVGLAVYAAAADYATVSGQAAKYHVAYPFLNPIGILGGLFGITFIDIALTWIGRPIWWLRGLARLFAVGVVLANASAGWPSLVGTGLRIAAPVLFIVIVEAARKTLLRGDEDIQAERARRREGRIPRIRWLLDFRGTWRMWKRMRLWGERSYSKAVAMELERLAAMERLAAKYGVLWEQEAPRDVAWMLGAGVRMTEALAKVAELTAPETVPQPAAQPAAPPAPKRARKTTAKKTRTAARSRAATEVPQDVDARAEALAILAAEPDISGAKLGVRVGKSERWGQLLKSELATAPVGPELNGAKS